MNNSNLNRDKVGPTLLSEQEIKAALEEYMTSLYLYRTHLVSFSSNVILESDRQLSETRVRQMPYSSSLTDKEWVLIEPLLPNKKKTCPTKWSKREILDGILYQLKNGCNWCDLPKDLPPYSTVFWHYKQWRESGVIEKIRDVLHSQVRQQVKKKALRDNFNNH